MKVQLGINRELAIARPWCSHCTFIVITRSTIILTISSLSISTRSRHKAKIWLWCVLKALLLPWSDACRVPEVNGNPCFTVRSKRATAANQGQFSKVMTATSPFTTDLLLIFVVPPAIGNGWPVALAWQGLLMPCHHNRNESLDLLTRADRKSQVRQCLAFCSADG